MKKHVLFAISDNHSAYYLDGKLIQQDSIIDTESILSALDCCECGTTEVKTIFYSVEEYQKYFNGAGYPEQITNLPNGIKNEI